MTIHHARQLQKGSQVVCFNGKATLYASVVRTEPIRRGLRIVARYKKKDGTIGEMERTHRGFEFYTDFPSTNFPTMDELKIF